MAPSGMAFWVPLLAPILLTVPPKFSVFHAI
jgi:hypothetical protein